MTGMEPFLASLLAAAEAAGSAVVAGAEAVGTAAAGLTTTEAVALTSAVAGTGAQLLAEKPKVPNISPMTRDDAALEANQRSELYKRRGRAATLLTPGGAKGDTTSPSLGAAALLGA